MVEKITTLGSAKTIVIEVQKESKSGNRKKPNETPGKVQRKRKVEASEDKAIKEKIRKAETVSRNERQKKELTDFKTGRIFPFLFLSLSLSLSCCRPV